MRNKKRCILSFLLVFFIFGVSIPLFMTTHKKLKADTINNLTNTTWVFNNSLVFNISPQTFYINFTSDNYSYTRLQYMYDDEDGDLLLYLDGSVVYGYGMWLYPNSKTITITGGTDTTNSTLISWLQNNATQQQVITGTRITHRYWAPTGVITMSDDEVIGDTEIEYTVLFNQYNRSYDDTIQTGLKFLGVQTNQNPSWSYIESINGSGINMLYRGETNNINNTMWLEFTPGDYMDTELYDFMTLWGEWFDDENAYLVGMNQGYVEGVSDGRALGQADGVEYTNLISSIFNGVGDLLSIQVFPNITIALIIGLPLLLGVLIIIIKLLRG